MSARTRDNDDEQLARIDMILEDLRLNTEHLHKLSTQANARAATRRREARALVHQVREARAERAAKKR